jgi:hypothetical protein
MEGKGIGREEELTRIWEEGEKSLVLLFRLEALLVVEDEVDPMLSENAMCFPTKPTLERRISSSFPDSTKPLRPQTARREGTYLRFGCSSADFGHLTLTFLFCSFPPLTTSKNEMTARRWSSVKSRAAESETQQWIPRRPEYTHSRC